VFYYVSQFQVSKSLLHSAWIAMNTITDELQAKDCEGNSANTYDNDFVKGLHAACCFDTKRVWL